LVGNYQLDILKNDFHTNDNELQRMGYFNKKNALLRCRKNSATLLFSSR